MSSLAEDYISPTDYLELERKAETKSEYFNGQIFSMSGASEAHILITGNLAGELRGSLRGGSCRVYASEMKVLIDVTGLYTYPDVIVACGERRFADERTDILLNPGVIFEVLSSSTESYDRGEKFAHYRHVESLTDYILVAQDRPSVEHFTKHGDQEWVLRVTEGLDSTLSIPTLGCELSMAFIYENVEFPNEKPLR